MAILIRKRKNGRSFELRIKHKLLPKPVYSTWETEALAREFGEGAENFMDRGIVPEGLKPKPKFLFENIAGAIRAYEKAKGVPRSTSNVLTTVSRDIGTTPLLKVDYLWGEAWIRSQKLKHHRSPGTIRHHVGALSRCFNWVVNAYPSYLANNPLARLERGYASYNELEVNILKAEGVDAPEDQEIDRRLEPDEEAAVVRILGERIAREVDPVQKAWHEGALLIFLLALETAMRMREMYSLRWGQIDLAKRTVHLTKTKNGDRRNVPLSSVAIPLLAAALEKRGEHKATDLVFPFWNGIRSVDVLDACTSAVSAYFGAVFAEAGCADFNFHSTRSEAICRIVLWVPLIGPQLTETQVARITGHKDPRMLRRYMNLRGSELAPLLR